MGVGGQHHALGHFTARKESRYPFYRRLGVPQGQSCWLVGCENLASHWDSILGPSSRYWVAISQLILKLKNCLKGWWFESEEMKEKYARAANSDFFRTMYGILGKRNVTGIVLLMHVGTFLKGIMVNIIYLWHSSI